MPLHAHSGASSSHLEHIDGRFGDHMSIVNIAFRNERCILVIGLDREDIDHLIGADVVYLEARNGSLLPDLALFVGETEADLINALNEMAKDHDA